MTDLLKNNPFEASIRVPRNEVILDERHSIVTKNRQKFGAKTKCACKKSGGLGGAGSAVKTETQTGHGG